MDVGALPRGGPQGTPLGQQEMKSVDVKKFCYEKTDKNLLGALGGNMSFMYAGVYLPIVPSGLWVCCAFCPWAYSSA